ncbi:MAG: hypothetical protein HY716_02165 [Planctomycetes bacterium]|nr:hypothetical protein [Planctomycetota bacterium]
MSEPKSNPERASIAQTALKLGWITREQLARCARVQLGPGRGKSLVQILVEQGYLRADQARQLAQRTSRESGAARHPSARQAPSRASKGIWIASVAMAAVPLMAIGAFLLLRSAAPPPTPPSRPEAVNVAEAPPTPEKTPEKEATAPSEERIRARLEPLSGSGPIVSAWNDLVARFERTRDPEQYKPLLPDLERLVVRSRGSPHEEAIREGYLDVVNAVKRRAEQVYAFLTEETSRLCAAGKFGEAIRWWDLFPLNLDSAGTYEKRIAERRDRTLDQAKSAYAGKRAEAERLIAQGNYVEARLILQDALEIGLLDLVEDAYARLTALTHLEDAAARKADEEKLAEFQRIKREEREITELVARYQEACWDLVSSRKLDAAEALLRKDRPSAAPEVAKALDQLLGMLDEMKSGFALAAASLRPNIGRTVSLTFLEGGEARPRALHLKDVRDGRITHVIEGKELSLPAADLHASELLKLAAGVADGPSQALLRGMSRMLANEFHEAHADLQHAGGAAVNLLAFVEGSTRFLERAAPAIRDRAARYLEEKRWEQAAQEFTRLAALPAERPAALKSRARAYYQMGHFVGTVLDVEALFELGDFPEEMIDLLNLSYKRSTLIAKAIQIYETANRRVPDNPKILANLVMLYMQLHRYVEAYATLKRAEKLKGYDPALFQMAELLHVAREPAFPGRAFESSFGRYDVQTNVSQEVANKMARFMSEVYRDYAKVFPYKKNETLRFHVKLFAHKGEFHAYYRKVTRSEPVSPFGEIQAYYMPATKELVGWNDEDIEETLRHEGLHQFIDYFISDCPIWFNEGYASYFEKSTADEVNFNPGRHRTARHLLHTNRLPGLKELFLMDGATFRKGGALHYGSSWSAIYFFIKSGRKSVLDRTFEALMEGKTQEQAFQEVFGPGKFNVEEIEAKWRRAVFDEVYE